ncbi:opacity family porin [Neisseria zalophi]|uniref:Autotransporter outer membrane beta-barrel domain-containing protein n=1 Tax=Neisseria zalophi TaxID=640030 RepID=A0A5J6PWA4_9NEIS|nr:opacity family porin [Neisseria zalophi]QEY25122.1 autotransporter outer membrane beta-barrel domain-containing protein [Neisseria zalophi]
MKQTSTRISALLLAAFAASVSSAAFADDTVGPYVQGDIGLAHLKFDDGKKFKIRNTFRNIKDSYKESGFMPRISAGYDYGDFRVAGDYTHYKTISESSRDANSSANVKVKVRGIGASVIYDVPMQSNFQPYVGARLSVNKIKSEANVRYLNERGSTSDSSTKVGIGALAGVGYKINDNLTADAGYRFNRLTSDLNTHEVSVGLRYTFR